MILHELHTNAVKYGALRSDDGTLALEWKNDGESVELEWCEAGVPQASEPPDSGFGHRMIAMSVKSDLRGTIQRDWRPDGLRALVQFPLAA